MFVRETSRTGPWTQLWSWRGWNQAVSSGMKKLFQSDHTLLRWTLQYLLAVLVKTFPNRNSSRPTEFLRTLTPPLAPHLSQVFAQCVTISTVSNPLLHNVFDLISIQSENKQTPRFSSHPSIPCLLWSVPPPHNTLLELYRNVIKRENWIKKKIRFLFYLEISKVFRSSF